MTFDKNQSAFPSDFHREVWWWAVGMVPPEVSLTDEVKSKCGRDALEGCYQWHEYFTGLCGDMYAHADEYAPATARQYRDILENIVSAGTLRDDSIVWETGLWSAFAEKINRSKAYAASGVKLENCLRALERTGLICEPKSGEMFFHNGKYPKIFHAMAVFERSPNVRQTPARLHFAHCEFRQLYKSYSANYDELLRPVSDESLGIARAIHDYAKSLKIQRYIHFDTIKYKHKGVRVLDFSIRGDEYPTLRVNIGTCADPDANRADLSNDGFYEYLCNADSGIQEIFAKNLEKCDDTNHNHQDVLINGKLETICPYAKVRINPFKGDLEAIFSFIDARKASIDRIAP